MKKLTLAQIRDLHFMFSLRLNTDYDGDLEKLSFLINLIDDPMLSDDVFEILLNCGFSPDSDDDLQDLAINEIVEYAILFRNLYQ